jgi:ferritin-like metal-binding protein YciE
MAEMKTKENNENVEKFLNTVEDISKRKDCFEIAGLMKKASGFEPKMWGNAIVGFGSYHYKY